MLQSSIYIINIHNLNGLEVLTTLVTLGCFEEFADYSIETSVGD